MIDFLASTGEKTRYHFPILIGNITKRFMSKLSNKSNSESLGAYSERIKNGKKRNGEDDINHTEGTMIKIQEFCHITVMTAY